MRSSQSLPTRRPKRLGRFTPALLVEAWLALSCLLPFTAFASTPPGRVPSANSVFWLWLVGLVTGVVVLAVVLVTVLVGRAHRRRRELAFFEAENLCTLRIAEIEVQRQRAQQSQRGSGVQWQGQQPGRTEEPQRAGALQAILRSQPLQNVSLPNSQLVSDISCPNCHQMIRATAIYCPVCRYHLAGKEPQSVVAALPVTENRAAFPVAPADQMQGQSINDQTGDAAIEVKLRNLWNRVGQ